MREVSYPWYMVETAKVLLDSHEFIKPALHIVTVEIDKVLKSTSPIVKNEPSFPPLPLRGHHLPVLSRPGYIQWLRSTMTDQTPEFARGYWKCRKVLIYKKSVETKQSNWNKTKIVITKFIKNCTTPPRSKSLSRWTTLSLISSTISHASH